MTPRAPRRRTRFLRQSSRGPDRGARTGMHNDLSQGYFALFDLEPCFALAAERLDRAYRALATRVHPDRFAHRDDAARRQSLMLATHANEAYRTLKKPVLRARYLLGLRGVETADKTALLPREFLIEQMEWREALADAKDARDIVALERLNATVRHRSTSLHERLVQQLDREHDNPGAAETVHKLMFLEKLAAEIADSCAALEN
ncbi:MAG: Fe-S protein assembly co-chaperone HscB [Pseudomonadota bacterium]